MPRLLFVFLLPLCVVLTTGCGNPTPQREVDRSTSRDLTPENSFTDGIEGPATDAAGNVYAVNYQAQGMIGRVTPEGEAEHFVRLPEGSIGNGIRFSQSGDRFFVADYTGHNVLMVDVESRQVASYAHGPDANQPNDLAMGPDGSLYASDPNWDDNTGQLWSIKPGKFTLLESGMGTTNGIEVSPDGETLYVGESVQQRVLAYDIQLDGTLANKRVFHTFPDFGLDGMRCTPDGRLFVTRYGKGVVAVLSPGGELLTELPTQGKNTTNITFSPDHSLAYVTVADRGCIEVVDVPRS